MFHVALSLNNYQLQVLWNKISLHLYNCDYQEVESYFQDMHMNTNYLKITSTCENSYYFDKHAFVLVALHHGKCEYL